MLFDMFVIAIIAIIMIFSCCRLMTKLRHHEEAHRTIIVQAPIAVTDGSGIFPATFGPTPYKEYDLPPKYDDVIKNNNDFPAIHKSAPLEKVITQS